MIKSSQQRWEVGQAVKVGFLAGLTVLAAVPTPGDFAPDAYVLTRGTNYYSFVPHNGLNKITQDEARELIESAKRHQARAEAIAVEKTIALLAALRFQSTVLS